MASSGANLRVNYESIICREAGIWQDQGIVFYDSRSAAVPVAQFIGKHPLTPDCNKFSFEIFNEGQSCYITIGLCDKNYSPDRQPGWEPGSVAYHADDGGIFLGTGAHTVARARCRKGDVMACEMNFDRARAKFYKNNALVYTTDILSVPTGGFHPAVGMHSPGEAVKLLQKAPWQPHVVKHKLHPEAGHVYHSAICREVRVWHDVGVLCYSSVSPNQPVAQFVGAAPLTDQYNSFSFEIISSGRSCYIAIGLCGKNYNPDRQPGWNRNSVAYHADDGGIYLGSGSPSMRFSKCTKGDIMVCEFDPSEQRATFYKNYVPVYTTEVLSVPTGGFHPAVGMHSPGEVVRLLQKEPWRPL